MYWFIYVSLLFGFSTTIAEINLQNLVIPNIDDVTVIKERCDGKGGNGTYEKIKTVKSETQSCLQDIIDFSAVKNEIEEAKKTGSMDEVFGKYCNKRPKISECVTKFIDAIKPCLEDNEKQALNLTTNILKQLGDFVCFRDGDRLAMFVAEGGVECLKDHTEGVQTCLNATFKVNMADVNVNSLQAIASDRKCDDLTTIQTCVVHELEKCKDTTPANIVDALFRFVKRSACPKNKSKRNVYYKHVKRSAKLVGYHTNEQTQQTHHKLTLTLSNFIMERCEVYGSEKARKAYNTSLYETHQCVVQHVINNNRKYSKSLIAPIIALNNCSNDIIETSEACLPPEERYLPQFVSDIMEGIIKVIISNENIIKDPSRHIEVLNCFQVMKSTNNNENSLKTSCFKNYNFDLTKVLIKDDICSVIENGITCVDEQFTRNCVPDVVLTKFKNHFVHALTDPCK